MADTFKISDVFISYAREDTAFVKRLTERLEAEKQEVWVDWQEIPESAEWWSEIKAGIEATSAFVFVISPDSAESRICYDEIQHAIVNNKRFIPILHRNIETKDYGEQLHTAISSHNWLFFTEASDFETTYTKLKAILQQDLKYRQAHTRLLVRARDWQEHQDSSSYLLFGEDSHEAEIWLAASEGKNPLPTELQRHYIQKSIEHNKQLKEQSKAQKERELTLQTQAANRLRYLVAVMGISLIVTIGLLGLTVFTQQKLNNERAENAYAQGKIYLDNQQFGEASAIFASLLELRPDSFDAHLLRAEALYGNKDYEQALVHADQAIRLNSNITQAYLIRARIHTALQLWDDAIADFNQVIAMQADSTVAYFERGLAFQNRTKEESDNQQTNRQLAYEDFSHVIELDPDFVDAYVQRGNWQLDQLNNEAAIDDFNKAIDLDSNKAQAYGGRSVALLNLNDVENASDDFNRFVSLQPSTHFERLPVDLEQISWFAYYGNTNYAYKYGKTWGYDKYSQGLHGGIDFGIERNDIVDVYAGVNGFYAGANGGGNNRAIIIQVDNYQIYYFHLDNVPDFEIGQPITPDTYLGNIMSTSNSLLHLHLEIRYQDHKMLVNPLYFTPPILIREILDAFPNFNEQFYKDDNWTIWQDPFNQPVIKLGGDIIGPTKVRDTEN